MSGAVTLGVTNDQRRLSAIKFTVTPHPTLLLNVLQLLKTSDAVALPVTERGATTGPDT